MTTIPVCVRVHLTRTAAPRRRWTAGPCRHKYGSATSVDHAYAISVNHQSSSWAPSCGQQHDVSTGPDLGGDHGLSLGLHGSSQSRSSTRDADCDFIKGLKSLGDMARKLQSRGQQRWEAAFPLGDEPHLRQCEGGPAHRYGNHRSRRTWEQA